ncbi:uncharacterized protein LOC112270064 [Brachypodium distachyon]|uniref:uncharacterized protein LOC112270064 n=1 Tax=Brachypodium distachyon TaxID=15368 RepID=UPI000D0D639D|nr:uncharacterized protein LOC112270064 [Brachypodium distachyon]|eukprot:XP_024313489.1 uncharacterized protein LOC112270064 [Brachypodium distachyon]
MTSSFVEKPPFKKRQTSFRLLMTSVKAKTSYAGSITQHGFALLKTLIGTVLKTYRFLLLPLYLRRSPRRLWKWKCKNLLPRIKTFSWRLFQHALPTGKRAGKISKHISKNCARCGALEDEIHIFFLCPFAKAAWFAAPWFIGSEFYVQHENTIINTLIAISKSGHPKGSIQNIFTFLWCIWKSRNNFLFNRKLTSSIQVFPNAKSLIAGTELELTADPTTEKEQGDQTSRSILISTSQISHLQEFNIYLDVAWKDPGTEDGLAPAGLGIFIKSRNPQNRWIAQIQAISSPVLSAIHDEALGALLAANILSHLHQHQAINRFQMTKPLFCLAKAGTLEAVRALVH